MGERFLSKIQYGKETTRGTAVAADTIWPGQVGAVVPDRKPTYPVEQFGVRAESHRSVISNHLVQDTLQCEHGSFQQLPVLFGCGLKGGVTAVEQNTGEGDYLWDFTPSLTGANSPDSLTIEKGDDVQAWEAEYCMFERIALNGVISQGQEFSPVGIEAAFFGRQWTAGSFTGGLSLPSMEPMDAIKTQLYIDTAWSGIGGTEKTGVLREFNIELLTGVHPKFHGGSNKSFNAHAEGLLSLMMNFVLEGNSTADAIWDAQIAQTLQAVRVKSSGSQIGSGDTHSLIVDAVGTWEDVQPLSAEDRGNNLHSAVFHAYYDSTGASLLDVNVTTDISAY